VFIPKFTSEVKEKVRKSYLSIIFPRDVFPTQGEENNLLKIKGTNLQRL
jgi:hypothetical protein